jgi:hypothetical protein
VLRNRGAVLVESNKTSWNISLKLLFTFLISTTEAHRGHKSNLSTTKFGQSPRNGEIFLICSDVSALFQSTGPVT